MSDQALRQQLANVLSERQAHMGFESAVAGFPMEHINTRPTGVDYTFWHLVDHLRFTQWDILDYIRNPKYEYTSWPDGYWPASDATTDAAGWQKTIDAFLADRAELVRIVRDPATDLYTQIPHGEPGHNVLREILVVADHNAYHVGEFAILRQVMQLW
ncbi:MAG: DinB family protein [Chloroflexi bacterium]|nr:DinB family protein [Chloroflexota bacterium]